MITFVLSDDMRNRVTARPSGTEPKLKYYIQLFEPVELDDVRTERHRLGGAALEVARQIVDVSGEVIGADLSSSDGRQLDAWRAEWTSGVRRLV
jgi:hypothetical protein